MFKVDNAIIMAAGTSSRFAPLSYEKHKGLIEVKGEVLIERQIKQLREVNIKDIIIVTGYKKEDFEYLKDKYNIKLIHNENYLNRNNNSSLYVAKNYLKNSYICSCDNYFGVNPFEEYVDGSYYSALYSVGKTNERCIQTDKNGFIENVNIGGKDSWYMMGHVFFDQLFSEQFIDILDKEYYKQETKDKLWEKILIENLDKLKIKIREYNDNDIFEFDTLDELRKFDSSYISDTRSTILKNLSINLGVEESELNNFEPISDNNNEAIGFTFKCKDKKYIYNYASQSLKIVF